MPERSTASERGSPLVPADLIERRIYRIRGQKVMIDADLAELYDVPTKSLNLAVKRNRKRFPSDFMFKLDTKEADVLRFQIGTSKTGRGGRRYLPYAFTEQGVAMLSSVLRSERAVEVNIESSSARGTNGTHRSVVSGKSKPGGSTPTIGITRPNKLRIVAARVFQRRGKILG